MLDFCFTIPYGLLLVVGGVIGYSKKGSTASLAGGAGTGLLLVLAGILSLQAYNKRKNSYFALILETGFLQLQSTFTIRMLQNSKCSQVDKINLCSIFVSLYFWFCITCYRVIHATFLETAIAALLTWVMTQRYLQTSKIMPAGMVAGISFLMTGFYLYKIANGGNHIPPKSD